VKKFVDAVDHILVLDKLAAVGLLNASLHACGEAGLIFEHPGNGVLHKLLGVLAVGDSYLLKPRFNVGREMHFHALKLRENQETGNTEKERMGPATKGSGFKFRRHASRRMKGRANGN